MLHRLVPTTPATRRGGELFLALAVFAVIVQLPGNVIVSLVLPPIALLINGIQAVGRRGEWCVWLWTLLTLIPATIAVIRWDLLMERPYLLQVIAVTLAAVVTLRGSQGTDGARALMQGMYAGFAALALIGVAEVIPAHHRCGARRLTRRHASDRQWVAVRRAKRAGPRVQATAASPP